MIVVDDLASLGAGADPVTVVACSASVRESERDRIRLPSEADTPNCRTGLPRQCWAVPRWYFPVERNRLTDYRGYLSRQRLKDVILAYLIRDEEARSKGP